MKDHKRLLRELKRNVKKDGNRSRRRHFQRDLENNPETTHETEYEFNEHNTSTQYQRLDGEKSLDKRGVSKVEEEVQETPDEVDVLSIESEEKEENKGQTSSRTIDPDNLRSTGGTGKDALELIRFNI